MRADFFAHLHELEERRVHAKFVDERGECGARLFERLGEHGAFRLQLAARRGRDDLHQELEFTKAGRVRAQPLYKLN